MEAKIQTEWIYSGSQMLFYKLIISVIYHPRQKGAFIYCIA